VVKQKFTEYIAGLAKRRHECQRGKYEYLRHVSV
jgi:hypothetical protein